MFHLLQFGSFMAWLLVAFVCSGSLYRDLTGHPYRSDDLWSLFCLVALMLVGFKIRWLAGMAAEVRTPAGHLFSSGLLLAQTLIATAVLWRRHAKHGFSL